MALKETAWKSSVQVPQFFVILGISLNSAKQKPKMRKPEETSTRRLLLHKGYEFVPYRP